MNRGEWRIWDYAAAPSRKIDELTGILVDGESGFTDRDAPKDVSPLESQRSWERQAEENLLARLIEGHSMAAIRTSISLDDDGVSAWLWVTVVRTYLYGARSP